jgi:2-amino-4-hydroxy-6-hydroxymethyldihydropteridine diphosphokinase
LIEAESIAVCKMSNWYETPAFPAGSGPNFINAVVQIETDKSAHAVLTTLHAIEKQVGRTRDNRWEPRICDLDLLDFSGQIHPDRTTYDRWQTLPLDQQKVETPADLILPHPRIADRSFVLIPLRDVAPDWVHPVTGVSVEEMIAALPAEDIEQIQVISP